MHQAESVLQASVENLYTVFARYPLAEIEHCKCCVTPEENARLSAKPLRELTEADFGRYPGKAITTWGHDEDYKHFLPRLLELVLTDAGGFFLGYAGDKIREAL